MDSDQISERLDPDSDPVCPERLHLDPDPDLVNIRPDPKPSTGHKFFLYPNNFYN